jgi:hypothetical protein
MEGSDRGLKQDTNLAVEWTDENHEKPQSRQSVSRLKFEPETSRIRNRIATRSP